MPRNPRFDVEKELDQVVGSYEPGRGERLSRRYGRLAARVLAAACLAIAAAALVFFVLDRHVRKAQEQPAPRKPVPVQIVPAR